MVVTLEQLRDMVVRKDFTPLIGEVESDLFDCKSQPYALDTDNGKRTLSADVAAYANQQGGYLLVGLKTEASTQAFGDEVKSVHPIPRTLVDVAQYKSIILDWVYPKIDGLEVIWCDAGENKGILVIHIPEQSISSRPFLVVRTIDGTKRVETLYGYVVRQGDGNQPFSVADFHKALSSGLYYEQTVSPRLESIENLLGQVVASGQEVGNKTTEPEVEVDFPQDVLSSNRERPHSKLDEIMEFGSVAESRALIFEACPRGSSGQLETIFSSGEDSIKKKLENPPTLRYAGWDIQTLSQAKILRGELLRVNNAERKVIDLYRDGSFLFMAKADNDFLAWGSKGEGLRLNSLAVIEAAYNFIRFYEFILDDFSEKPDTIFFRVHFRNMHLGGEKSFLVPYALGTWGYAFHDDAAEAPRNEDTKSISVKTAEFNPSIATYQIVREIYLWFGLEESKIPYIKEEDGITMIDVEAISNTN